MVRLDPRFRGGDESEASWVVKGAHAAPLVIPAQAGIHDKADSSRHSRASGKARHSPAPRPVVIPAQAGIQDKAAARGVSLGRRFGGGIGGAANYASQQASVVRLHPRFRGGDESEASWVVTGANTAPPSFPRTRGGPTRPSPASFPRKRESKSRRTSSSFLRAARPNAAARGVSLGRRLGGGIGRAANYASQEAGVVRLDPRFRGSDDTGRDGS